MLAEPLLAKPNRFWIVNHYLLNEIDQKLAKLLPAWQNKFAPNKFYF